MVVLCSCVCRVAFGAVRFDVHGRRIQVWDVMEKLVLDRVCKLVGLDHVEAVVLRDGSDDLNMRAALLHMIGDAAASLGGAAAGMVILVTGGYEWLDPAVSLGIALLIAVQAWKLVRQSVDVLLESTPRDLDPDVLSQAMKQVEGVDDVHDLHVWSLSSEVRALSARSAIGTGAPRDRAGHSRLSLSVGSSGSGELSTDGRHRDQSDHVLSALHGPDRLAAARNTCSACPDEFSAHPRTAAWPEAGSTRHRVGFAVVAWIIAAGVLVGTFSSARPRPASN
jgi:Cation efflux family